jgi:hypothetical protein
LSVSALPCSPGEGTHACMHGPSCNADDTSTYTPRVSASLISLYWLAQLTNPPESTRMAPDRSMEACLAGPTRNQSRAGRIDATSRTVVRVDEIHFEHISYWHGLSSTRLVFPFEERARC